MGSKLTCLCRKQNNSAGMTLVEVMIAVVLLSLILIAVISLTNISITGIFSSGAKSQAIAAAMEKNDQIYYLITSAKDADQAEADMRSTRGWVESSQYLSRAYTEPQFYYKRTAYEVSGYYAEGFDVTVVVYYNGGRNHVEMQAFVLKSSKDD